MKNEYLNQENMPFKKYIYKLKKYMKMLKINKI